MVKRLITLMITFLLIVSCAAAAFGAEKKQRVFDRAGLFSAEEKDGLEEELNNAVDETGLDLVILTTSDKEGAGLRDYADDFYDQGDFGTDKDGSGLLMLIDMEDRTVYVSTKGDAIRYFTDYRLLELTDNNDELYDHLADGEYAEAAQTLIDGSEYWVAQGIPEDQYNYNEETGERDYYESRYHLTVFEILISIAASAVIGYLYIRSIRRQYAMTAEKKNTIQHAREYRNACSFAFAVNTDELLHHSVTSRIIPRTHSSSGSGSGGSSSTIHTSSSGSFHGGGGGGRHF